MEIAKTNTRGMSVEELRAVQKDCRRMSIECLDRMYAVKLDLNNLTHAAVTERDKWFKRHVKNGRESSRLYKLLRRRDNARQSRFEAKHLR